MSIWLFLVHWLHVIGAAIWFGGSVIGYFVLFPSLLQRPAPEGRAGAVLALMVRMRFGL